ncbi:hypothetical protein LWI28_020186 [Acer negundo]|uniref:Uncharacterized protein n=1 Tax=Acer negundo TaxID=4023 RepID=A0AAD5IV15_ACENE|nr:hypothetical protein LWI28_020186 [Acer negundo]
MAKKAWSLKKVVSMETLLSAFKWKRVDDFIFRIIGEIPDVFINLTQLSVLGLASNQLSGAIPSSVVSGLQNLAYINLEDNSLGGAIPSGIFSLPSLKTIYLGDNQLTGRIDEFQSNSSLQRCPLNTSHESQDTSQQNPTQQMAKKAWWLKKAVSTETLLSAFKWKQVDFQTIDDFIFRIMYVVEAIVLVSALCFFFLCCGRHF